MGGRWFCFHGMESGVGMRHLSEVFGGQVALVTGGASGIGKALCGALAKAGATVWLTDRDGIAAQVAAEELGHSTGQRLHALPLDVTDAETFRAVVGAIQHSHGPVDLLVNNAGMGLAGEFCHTTDADWRRVMEVNLWGVLNGINAVYADMRDRRQGQIINVSSGAALLPRPGMAAYAASKAAVLALSVSMRAEAAAAGVKVNCACPGPVDTGITQATTYRGVDATKLLKRAPTRGISPDACAREILDGAAHDKALIPITGILKIEWLLYRLCPPVIDYVARLRAKAFRESRI
jgi:short-subunit dehydrogenase